MNNIVLSGILEEDFEYSHTILSEDFYKTTISVERNSGTKDFLKCIVPEVFCREIKAGDFVEIIGEVRTRNVPDGDRKKLDIFVFAKDIKISDKQEYKNDVFLNGFICKEPIERTTPLGRVITDVLVASQRNLNFKSDYIPCVAWGRNALRVSDMVVGNELYISGRMQSRMYKKQVNDEKEERIAYELSISGIELVKNEEERSDLFESL